MLLFTNKHLLNHVQYSINIQSYSAINIIFNQVQQSQLYIQSCSIYIYISRSSVELAPMAVWTRVSTGIPGYGWHTEMIRKFFPFPLWKRFRKTGIPERFFSRKTEISLTFRNIVPEIFRKIVPEISGFRNNWYHNYICKYNTS